MLQQIRNFFVFLPERIDLNLFVEMIGKLEESRLDEYLSIIHSPIGSAIVIGADGNFQKYQMHQENLLSLLSAGTLFSGIADQIVEACFLFFLYSHSDYRSIMTGGELAQRESSRFTCGGSSVRSRYSPLHYALDGLFSLIWNNSTTRLYPYYHKYV